ncbi:PTS transporter subunit EIIC [Brevibacillus daliensis]|uniref:PTS transporter subunit EIIC n=1 Tax=Brevibacillus daliensis TaxID=2892995 RepID=UPI001E3C9ED7|nr:PTS transporter subunit EIIC [Brevibacillus daliensis]
MLAFLQKIGKSLMLPVASLPAASILLRFGNIDYVKDFGMGTSGEFINTYVAPFLAAGGSAIFDNLPLIFAVGVAIGLAGDAVAALAAVIAQLVLLNVLKAVPGAFSFIDDALVLNMGVLGGILSGGLAAYFFNKYHNIKLPDWLGFFSGKRFVPIVTSSAMVIVGLLCGLVWGPVQEALNTFGNYIVSLGAVGSGVFGFVNRLLIPFGLHHVINTIAWFEIGTFTNAAGELIKGDLHRFFAGDTSAGLFMTGFFPIMMFAMPGIALAIVHSAKPENRKTVASIFMSTAIAAFLTGITEPVEFAFMFAAPVLYGIHAVLTGVISFIIVEMGVRLGFGFSAGLIDYGINFKWSTKPLLLWPIGLATFVLYYFLFRLVIKKFNLKTPGREDDFMADPSGEEGAVTSASPMKDKAEKVLVNLGGKENVKSVDACITRLRLVVNDDKKVNDAALKQLGAAGVMRLGGGSVQVVFGTQSEALKDEINKL